MAISHRAETGEASGYNLPHRSIYADVQRSRRVTQEIRRKDPSSHTALESPYTLRVPQAGKPDLAVTHRCTSSIGVVMFIDHEASAADILKWADQAMYQAKKEGRNRISFFDPKAAMEE